jgi:hypothetical protein
MFFFFPKLFPRGFEIDEWFLTIIYVHLPLPVTSIQILLTNQATSKKKQEKKIHRLHYQHPKPEEETKTRKSEKITKIQNIKNNSLAAFCTQKNTW